MPKGIYKHKSTQGFQKGNKFWDHPNVKVQYFEKGHIVSEEIRKKHSESVKGEKNPNYGKPAWNRGKKLSPLSEETKRKISEANKIAQKGKHIGEKNANWKGDDVGYKGLHIWINKKLGHSKICEHCGKSEFGKRQIHWANKSGKYKRDLDDWLRLCVKCHKKYDTAKRNFV